MENFLVRSNYNVIEFTGCTDHGGGLKYWCEWPNGARKIVSATEARDRFPSMVAIYLESRFDGAQISYDSDSIMVTRSVKLFARNENVSLDPKFKVLRSLCLERYLLEQPRALRIDQRRITDAVTAIRPQQIGQRRATMAYPQNATDRKQPQANKVVPIGARGRKRKESLSILYIGIKPNLDGHKTPQMPNNSDDSVHASAGNTPPVRTYIHSSTPIRGRMLTFTPSPPMNVTTSTHSDESTIDITFYGSPFGQLQYSASSSNE